jgi:hypothetical protein
MFCKGQERRLKHYHGDHNMQSGRSVPIHSLSMDVSGAEEQSYCTVAGNSRILTSF